MTLEQAIVLPREQLEQGLHLQGLLLFRNELKPDTPQAVSDLKQGQVTQSFLYITPALDTRTVVLIPNCPYQEISLQSKCTDCSPMALSLH